MHGPLLPRPRFWAEAVEQKKTRFTILGETFVFLLVYFIANAAQSALISIPLTVWTLQNRQELFASLVQGSNLSAIVDAILTNLPDWLLYLSLFTAAFFAVAAFIYCTRFEKRSLASMGLRRGGIGRELGLGAGIGLLMAAAVAGIGSAAKCFRVGSIALSGEGLPLLLLMFLGCLVQGSALEIFFRGYLATSIGTRLPVAFAVGFSSLVSTAVANSAATLTSLGFVNAILLGILLCVYMIKRGNLWGACGLHALWSFGVTFFFGFIPEGSAPGVCVIPVYTAKSNTLLTGGEFGPEASLCATIALLAGLAILLALKPKDPIPVEPEAPINPAV